MHAVRTTSGHPVCRVAFSPCGSHFATAQPHHGLSLHDRASGAAVRTFGNPRRPDYTSVVFLRGGEWLAAAGSKGLEVFEVSMGTPVAAGTSRPYTWLSVGETGDVLRGGHPTLGVLTLRVDAAGGGVGYHPYFYDPPVVYPQLSPHGRWAVGFREGAGPVAVDLRACRVALALCHPFRWDWRARTETYPVVTFAVARVALGDGKTVAVFDVAVTDSGGCEGAKLPDPRPVGTAMFTLPPPDRWPADKPWRPPFALTPDGRGLLVKRPRERVQLWDVDAGTLAAEWSWRLEGITCLAVAPDGLTAVAGGRFGRVLTWDLE